ncbi:MAG: murein DD-endopeptidase MepM/ murein hydrolase activator NlpD [Oceanicoccus sp.]
MTLPLKYRNIHHEDRERYNNHLQLQATQHVRTRKATDFLFFCYNTRSYIRLLTDDISFYMQHAQNKNEIQLYRLLTEFPRKHLIIASTIIISVLFFLLLMPSQIVQAKRISQPISLELDDLSTSAVEPIAAPEPPWKEVTIQKGDNLSTIFQRAALSPGDVYDIVNKSQDSKSLLKLQPGQKLTFQVDDSGKLQALQHIHNRMQSTLFKRDGDKFDTTHIQREPEIRQNYKSAVINSSLFRAAQRSGLSQNSIMELANIFGGVIDFVYDVRAGDSFTLLFEEHYLDDSKMGDGPILAAQFTNRGETYTAYRYAYEDGSVGYFNEDGVSMRKAFLRAPLDFTRISSSFNLKRLHPIFKTNKPHRGIDYAASTGTPVYAAGDGRVSRSGYSKANGNYVFINHGTQYETKYLHLHKRGVKSGQKISQQQIIGWVGSTGYATGPHLHYEFLVNGVHRNPRTILNKLPKAKSISATDKERFFAQISGFQTQLAAYINRQNLADASQASNSASL